MLINACSGFRVHLGNQLASKLLATRPFTPGDVIVPLKGFHLVKNKSYTTVQVDCNQHIELNSGVRFMNHSCAPTCSINTRSLQVIANQEIQPGQELTFFYPSTEWDMASSFQCWCRHEQCIGRVRGAKYIDYEVLLSFGHINPHIHVLKKEQLQRVLSKLTQNALQPPSIK